MSHNSPCINDNQGDLERERATLARKRMSRILEQVHRFYELLWNTRGAHDDADTGRAAVVSSILDEDVTFRGSVGQETRRGHDGFAEYVDAVHGALDGYNCTVEDLVVKEGRGKAFARMSFGGIHRVGREFMGYEGTGRRVPWSGCALLTFSGGDDAVRMKDVWVLGDLKGLKDQLERNKQI